MIRFWEKVLKQPGGCWLWLGARFKNRKGEETYGCFSMGSRTDGSKRMHAAHRVAWRLENGSVPEGMKVLHRCDTPLCVRPSHLFLGSQADNITDMVRKGRAWWQEVFR